jgi:hypothetical protein
MRLKKSITASLKKSITASLKKSITASLKKSITARVSGGAAGVRFLRSIRSRRNGCAGR